MAGGALLAQLVAVELGTNFAFAERTAAADGLVQYRIPGSLRSSLNRKRVLLVDDAVNAGSALLSTVTDLLRCRAELVGLACLLTLGEAAGQIAKQHSVPLSRLATLERGMWQPNACPLCAAGMPLTSLV